MDWTSCNELLEDAFKLTASNFLISTEINVDSKESNDDLKNNSNEEVDEKKLDLSVAQLAAKISQQERDSMFDSFQESLSSLYGLLADLLFLFALINLFLAL